jgi:hypothetical protein
VHPWAQEAVEPGLRVAHDPRSTRVCDARHLYGALGHVNAFIHGQFVTQGTATVQKVPTGFVICIVRGVRDRRIARPSRHHCLRPYAWRSGVTRQQLLQRFAGNPASRSVLTLLLTDNCYRTDAPPAQRYLMLHA